MDPTSLLENKKKWKYFLSSIKSFKTLPTNNLKINTKSKSKCLASEFANTLLEKKGGNVVFTGNQENLDLYKDTASSKHQPPQVKTENCPTYKDKSTANIDKRARKRVRDDAKIQQVDSQDIPTKIAKTSKNVQEKTAINTVVKLDDDTTHIEVSANDIRLLSHDIEIVRKRDRDTHTPSKKYDIDKPCSKWKVSNIAEYINFANCVTEIKIPTRVPSNLDEIYEVVQEAICLRLKIVKGSDLKPGKGKLDSEFLLQLKSKTSTEAECRLVLDALLIPLCSALNLQIEVNKNIDCNFLPNCRFNYCIRKEEDIIGCIEAKGVKSLNANSIAQVVIQLIVLQTTLMATGTPKVEISDFPLFAIVTDGHRFIFIQLRGSSLGFEHNRDKLKIREVGKITDFKDILGHIRFLIDGDTSEDDAIPIE
jgi:hypothetical protein